MPQVAKKGIRRVTIVYWALLLYIIAALVWWFISLEIQNAQAKDFHVRQLTATIDSTTTPELYKNEYTKIETAYKRKNLKFVSEGVTFLLLILVGASFVYRSARRQFKLQQQQQNFMMAVTHELKTPISVARLNLETLQKYSLDADKQKKLIRMTLQETERLNSLTNNILSTLVKLPEVITPTGDTLTDEEWNQFELILLAAIDDLNLHRLEEGKSLEEDLRVRINNIVVQQEQVIKLEPLRQQKIREGLQRLLEENVGKENYDGNRLEQELIYYIEKIDISEEQVRLKNHCDYFKNILEEKEESKGKKLSFILQEIGREINTTGAKAYDSTIQKCVVLMKDELEKAKEQILNVL